MILRIAHFEIQSFSKDFAVVLEYFVEVLTHAFLCDIE